MLNDSRCDIFTAMNTRFLLKFFDPGFILKAAFIILGLSLIILGEIFIIQFVGGFWGVYFTLAVAASTGLIGLFFSFREVAGRIRLIKDGVINGEYSEKDMVQLAGAILGGGMLLLPGFVTDFFGILSFFPVIRSLYGYAITRGFSSRFSEAYEYLRLYD